MSVSGVIAKRLVWITIGIVAVTALVLVWADWVEPGTHERDVAYAAACKDAASLHNAGMLDDARSAYVRIAKVKPQPDCARQLLGVEADDNASAAAAERAAVYFGASQLKLGESMRAAREVVLRRARNAYIDALSLDPYATGARRELAALIAFMGVPRTKDDANARCAVADQLRSARLFDAARLAYAQALRTGLTTSCARSGLRIVRQDRGAAERIVRRARALDKGGKPDEARPRYIAALAWDPMASGARAALDATDPPDPRKGTASGHLSDIAGTVNAGVG